MDELKKLYEELGKAVAEMRAANDRGNKETAEKANEAVSALQKQIKGLEQKLREVETLAARPAGPGGEKDQAKVEHAKAFSAYLRKGDKVVAELEQKALSVGVSADGGYAVPEDLVRQIEAVELNDTPMRALCRVDQAANDSHEIIVSLHGAATGWVAETAARTATNTPTLGSVIPTSGELYANPQATQKVLDDAMFNLEGWLSTEIGAQFAAAEDAAFISGDGTNKPTGILTATFAATADSSRAFGTLERYHSGTSASFDSDDLINLFHKMKPSYRRNASWVMSSSTVAFVRTLKEATTGAYMWRPGLEMGKPNLLLGRPVVEDENVPAMAASSYSVLLGDFKRGYVITDIGPVRMLRDPLTNKPYIGFYTVKRVGGKVLDSNAIKALYLAV